jgi:hypothetical protein
MVGLMARWFPDAFYVFITGNASRTTLPCLPSLDLACMTVGAIGIAYHPLLIIQAKVKGKSASRHSKVIHLHTPPRPKFLRYNTKFSETMVLGGR